jgi:hypothetical protein
VNAISRGLKRERRTLPVLRPLMRTVWKMAFALLTWPISVMAQAPPSLNQSNPPLQSSPLANDSMPSSDPITASSPAPTPILPVKAPPSPYFRLRKQPPIAAGRFTALTLSAGYSVTDLAIPSSSRVALTGVDVSIAADVCSRIGAKLDLSYARAPNVSNSGHGASVLSYLFGPTFSLWSGNSLSTHAHVLGGGARVTGTFPIASGGLGTGHVHYPALDFGGSAEYRLSPAFGFRVTIDCLHAHFFNSSGVIRGQNDIGVVNSIVYYLGEPVRRRHL